VQLKPKIGDAVLVFILMMIIVFAPVIMASQAGNDLTAVITKDGAVIAKVKLTGLENPVEIPYEGSTPGVIVAENGRVRFKEAHCPDQLCVKTGWLTKPGQTAACLPARVMIRIEGSSSTDEDIRLK